MQPGKASLERIEIVLDDLNHRVQVTSALYSPAQFYRVWRYEIVGAVLTIGFANSTLQLEFPADRVPTDKLDELFYRFALVVVRGDVRNIELHTPQGATPPTTIAGQEQEDEEVQSAATAYLFIPDSPEPVTVVVNGVEMAAFCFLPETRIWQVATKDGTAPL